MSWQHFLTFRAMDILRPSTVWINGICYRKNNADEGSGETQDDGDRNYGKRRKVLNLSVLVTIFAH